MPMSFMVSRANDVFSPVEATVATFGDDVSVVMTTKSNPFVPEGTTAVDYRQVMDIQLGMSRSARDLVVVKGKTYNRTKAKKNQVGYRFRGSIYKMAKKARKFRSAVEEQFGPEILEEIDLVRPILLRHTDTITHVEHAIELYEALDKSAFLPQEGMGTFDDVARIEYIRSLLDICNERKKVYELAVKKNDGARKVLEEEYGEFRLIFSSSTQVIGSLFRMAGFDEQSERLRYLVRRASGKSQKAETTGEDTQAADSKTEDSQAADSKAEVTPPPTAESPTSVDPRDLIELA
jgi:hypothetical protein